MGFTWPRGLGAGMTLQKALREVLESLKDNITAFLRSQLQEYLDQLAEQFIVKDSFLHISDGDCLREQCSSAENEQDFQTMFKNGRGIIAHTARTGDCYCCNIVEADPYYKPIVEGALSEQAGAISWHAERLAVIDQESHLPNHFSPATAQLLQESAQASLTLTLLNLRAVDERRAGCTFPTLWSPQLYGWDLRIFVAKILKDAKWRLGPRGRGLQLVVWYIDYRDHTMFSLATTGFSSKFVSEKTLPIHKDLISGRLAAAQPLTISTEFEEGGGTACPDQDRAMGLKAFRAIKVMDDTVPGGHSANDRKYGVMMSVYAFTDQAVALLPKDEDFRDIARLIAEQVRGYARLFPELAEAYANGAVYRSAGTSEQTASLAAAVRDVFKADAVTLYARPRTKKPQSQLHIIAATGPLSPGHGDEVEGRTSASGPWATRAREEPEPDAVPPSLRQSLKPCSHEVGERNSYAGALSVRPGKTVRKNQIRDSRRWLAANLWPTQRSSENQEYLPRAVGADPKLLGFAMPATLEPANPAMAHWVGGPLVGAPPYTAWDEKALEQMIGKSGHGVVCSWRDWYSVMKRTGHEKSSLSSRLTMPLPHINAMSLKSVSRELTAVAYDLMKPMLKSIYQAWILAEQPGARPMSVVPIGYFSEWDSAPRRGRSFALDAVSGLDWEEPFIDGGRWIFPGTAPEGERNAVTNAWIRKRICVPWKTWTGQHTCRGLLVVDLTQNDEVEALVLEILSLLARKIGAALSVTWTTLDHTPFRPWTRPEDFVKSLRVRLECAVRGARTEGTRFQAPSLARGLQRPGPGGRGVGHAPGSHPSAGRRHPAQRPTRCRGLGCSRRGQRRGLLVVRAALLRQESRRHRPGPLARRSPHRRSWPGEGIGGGQSLVEPVAVDPRRSRGLVALELELEPDRQGGLDRGEVPRSGRG